MAARRSTLADALNKRGSQVFDLDKKELFALVDKDGDGTLTRDDFDKLHSVITAQVLDEERKLSIAVKNVESSKRKMKFFAGFAIVIAAFLAVSVAANFAVMFSVVDKATTTTVSGSALEVKGTNSIVQVTTATENAMLDIAPFMAPEQLNTVSTLTVTRNIGEKVFKVGYTVTGYDLAHRDSVSSTPMVTFYTSRGDKVHVINGAAKIQEAGSTELKDVCTSLTCSAFKIDGADLSAVKAARDAYLLQRPKRESRKLQTFSDCMDKTGWEWLQCMTQESETNNWAPMTNCESIEALANVGGHMTGTSFCARDCPGPYCHPMCGPGPW